MRNVLIRLHWAQALAGFALVLGACSDSNPQDGFACELNEPRCPPGYECGADGICRPDGTGPGPDAAVPPSSDASAIYTVGGTVSGLAGSGLVLQNNGGDDLEIAADGPFTFATSLADGQSYDVTVLNQPSVSDQGCVVLEGTGTVAGADVTGVEVWCGPPVVIAELWPSARVVSPGESVTLSFATRNAASCELAALGRVEPGDLQSAEVTVEERTTFALRCEGYQGPVTRELTVEVTDSDWVQVSAGSGHTCGLKQDGRLFCWGAGTSLGAGDIAGSRVPVQEVTEAIDWEQVSAGLAHTCAVKQDGRLFCWGFGADGRLGNDDTEVSRAPVQEATAATDWEQVSTGSAHTCAVKQNGELFCWGSGADGRLGNDDTAASLVPVQEATGAADWTQVSAGLAHTCAVKDDGRLFCWGEGSFGRLGNDETAVSLVPVQEATEATDWAQVSTSAFSAHTCAVKRDGRLFCWGTGGSGQLGNGGNVGSRVPVQEATGAIDWAQVSIGSAYTCAAKQDGRLFCWGAGGFGRLGTGDSEGSLVPVQETTEAADWAQVSAGSAHTCAVKQDGRLFCWGSNSSGQRGNDEEVDVLLPSQEVSGAGDWIQTSAGLFHTCGVKTDGRVFCWGRGSFGRLGNDDTAASLVPVQESTEATDWIQVSAGGAHTCAVKQDGRLFCWGQGSSGQLGRPMQNSVVPVQESTEATDWVEVSAGGAYTCALKEDGRLFCWGTNSSGQRGTGDTPSPSTPTQESTGATDWAQVSAGTAHTCAVKQDGRLFCWGLGTSGQLGNYDNESSPVPVQEATEATDWGQVSAGQRHSCAVKQDGQLLCWGSNEHGQLGTGDRFDRPFPAGEATQATDWVEVTAAGATDNFFVSRSHTCALRGDGRLFCWGSGVSGRLGTGDTEDRVVPVTEATQSANWAQVAAGSFRTCSVRTDGRLFCWGLDDAGRLGVGERFAHTPVWPTD
jgi:alpha-tubulin suppressor-like RCC1 family protein